MATEIESSVPSSSARDMPRRPVTRVARNTRARPPIVPSVEVETRLVRDDHPGRALMRRRPAPARSWSAHAASTASTAAAAGVGKPIGVGARDVSSRCGPSPP